MSTILLATDWNLPIGWPNCLRRRACSMQRSSCRRIVPSVPARIAPRSHSIEQLKTSAPLPSRPSRASAGSSQSSSASSPIGTVRTPSLGISRTTRKPGVSRGTMKALMPMSPLLGSVVA